MASATDSCKRCHHQKRDNGVLLPCTHAVVLGCSYVAAASSSESLVTARYVYNQPCSSHDTEIVRTFLQVTSPVLDDTPQHVEEVCKGCLADAEVCIP